MKLGAGFFLGVAAVAVCVAAGAAFGQTDITDKFKDAEFRAKVYEVIGKTPPAPIFDSDVSGITELDVHSNGVPDDLLFDNPFAKGNISDLSGIEYFTALTYLNCYDNRLTTLDVSNNTALIVLNCSDNRLTVLDVSKNTVLIELYCNHNQLTTLDMSKNTALTMLRCDNNKLTAINVSKNTVLTLLDCHENQLTTLDIPENTVLTDLVCYINQLTTLDVSKNTALAILNCEKNQLTTLDVSKNTALTYLFCVGNPLTTLDVSKNTALKHLWCAGNQLTTLDVSKNTALTRLICDSNQLTTLDVSKNTALEDLVCHNNQLTTLDVSKNTALTYLHVYYNYFTSEDDIIGLNKSNLEQFRFDPQNDKDAILSPNRIISFNPNPSTDAILVSPVKASPAVITAGPNPAAVYSGAVNLFRNGSRIASAALFVYDASGDMVKKITIRDNVTIGDSGRRTVGSWDLRDAKGRTVAEGTYLIKGVLKTVNGKAEKVSLAVGVR